MSFTLPVRRHYIAGVRLYPLRDVAILFVEHGPRVYGNKSDRHWEVSYVTASPAEMTGDRIDVSFPRIGRINGRFVPDEPAKRGGVKPFCRGPRPVLEAGHFVGRFAVGGDGYPVFRGTRASAAVSRSFALRCKAGHAKNPPKRNPFAYIGGYQGLGFSNNGTGVVLTAETKLPRRVTEFVAVRDLPGTEATFTARTLEILPGGVDAIRQVELERVAGATFEPGKPARKRMRAVVAPPCPFTGVGVYHRSAARVLGDLSVHFPGRIVRIGGKNSEAHLLHFPTPHDPFGGRNPPILRRRGCTGSSAP